LTLGVHHRSISPLRGDRPRKAGRARLRSCRAVSREAPAPRFQEGCPTSRSRRHHLPLLAAALPLLLLSLSSFSLTSAGIIELGRKGQTSTASVYKVVIEGVAYADPNHTTGDLAETILGRIRDNINNDANGRFTATLFSVPGDPNSNALSVVRRTGGGDPSTLEVFIDDGNIKGAFVDLGMSGGFHARLVGVDTVNQNGSLEVDLIVHGGSFSHVITTASKTAAQVNAELVADFTADGFVFAGPANGPWDISKFGVCFMKLEMKATDTGVHLSGVEMDAYVPPTIPTLSEWGMFALISLLALGGAAIVRGSRQRGTPPSGAPRH
jgi:hypothetical protein